MHPSIFRPLCALLLLGAAGVRKGVPRGFSGLTDIIAGPEWACAAGLLVHGRGTAAAAKRGRPKAPGTFLSKLKTSLKGLFPASAA